MVTGTWSPGGCRGAARVGRIAAGLAAFVFVASPIGASGQILSETARQAAFASFFRAGAQTPPGPGRAWKPAYVLLAVGGAAIAAEAVCDRSAQKAYSDYLNAPTDAGYDKAIRWQGRRNAMPWVYGPSLGLGAAWIALDWSGGKTKPPVSGAASPSPVPTVPPATATIAPTVTARRPSASEQAGEHFERAREFYADGNLISALLELQQATALQPGHPEARAMIARINQGLAGPARAPTTEGNSLAQQKVIESSLREGFYLYNRGEFKKSIEKFKLVLALVASHADAARMMGEAQAKMDQTLKLHVAAAKKAREAGKLVREIAALQAALRVDDEHEESQKGLAEARARVPAEVNRLYKLGLDLYAAGRVKEAVARWKDGLSLDPNHEKTQSVLSKAETKLEEERRIGVGQ